MNNVLPKLRFSHFNNKWSKRAFYSLVSRVSETTDLVDLPRVEFEDIVSGLGALNKDINNKKSDKKGIKFNSEDILFGKLRPYLKNWLFADFQGIAIGDFWVLRPNDTDGYFIYALIQGPKYQRVANLSTGTKMPRSDWKTVSETKFSVPLHIEEQQKIGKFFKQLDDRITLQQSHVEQLKQSKQGFLQKMFPKDGESVPEVRFDNFHDKWIEHRLSDGMTEYTDRVIIENHKKYNQVSVKNIGEITLRGEKKGSEIGRKRQSKVNLKDFPVTLIFTRQTIEQGGIGFAPIETDGAIVTENMPTISINTKIFDKEYLRIFFKTEVFRKKVILPNIQGGTAQIAIHEDNIISSTVPFPHICEQQKIGEFFKKLDDLIAKNERELELLQETKKGFLQKMFV